MTWRIGASTGCCADRSVIEVLDALHAARISGVEVGTPPGHFDPWRQAEVHALRERLRLHEMCPVSIHAPFGGLLDLSDPNRHHRHAAIGAILTAAAALTRWRQPRFSALPLRAFMTPMSTRISHSHRAAAMAAVIRIW